MTDPLMTYAYSGDASQYRLVPAVVVIVNSEDEVRAVIAAARAEEPAADVPRGGHVARAARPSPTACSPCWATASSKMQVLDKGDRIVLGPAIIVAQRQPRAEAVQPQARAGPGEPGDLQDRRRGQQQLVGHVLRRRLQHLPHAAAPAA